MKANDMVLTISTARNRKTAVWQRREMTWARLAERLEQVERTQETAAEYARMSHEERAAVKDKGGFVGGGLKEGRRKRGYVEGRWVLTLDADNARRGPDGTWARFERLWPGVAAVLYSTHSNTERQPRYRIVVPLSRETDATEYEAAARLVAKKIGMSDFDASTYEPERLMYWPSAPKGGLWEHEEQTGEPLDVDALLDEYVDYRDAAEWPGVEETGRRLLGEARKAGDPRDKKGAVGLFCRTYSVEEAMETYLSDIYVPTTTPGRWTYKKGTTAGGLIIYDNGTYAYSHHGTDPAGGRLWNAYDLVRLHLFGQLDEGAKEDVGHRASDKAMAQLTEADGRCRKTAAREKEAEARAGFEALETEETRQEEEETGDDGAAWVAELDRTKAGVIKSTAGNLMTIFRHDKGLRDRLRLNELTYEIEATKALPWKGAPGIWDNEDDAGMRQYLECQYGIVAKDKILDAVVMEAAKRRYHPIKEYLEQTTWDGRARCETLLIDYLGAEDTPLTRAQTRKALTAAVARVYEPGTKFDYVVTLYGPEGTGKSTLLRKLGGPWFTDSFSFAAMGKDAMEQIRGAWIIECGELEGFSRAEVESVKAFISKTEDSYRPAYARRKETFKRQCVFWATTNNPEMLRGNQGNRRFWPIGVHENEPAKDLWAELTGAEVAQVWAEAKALWEAGEPLFLDKQLEEDARAVQALRNEKATDPRVGIIEEFLDRPIPANWNELAVEERRAWLLSHEEEELCPAEAAPGMMKRQRVCIVEIALECFGYRPEKLGRNSSLEIAGLMRYVKGWRYDRKLAYIQGYGRQRIYERI